MATRVPAAELTPRPSPPFAVCCRRSCVRSALSQQSARSHRVAARTPRRRPDGAIRITWRSASHHVVLVEMIRAVDSWHGVDRRAAVAHGSEGGAKRRREPLRRGTVSPRLPVPDHIPRPPYVGTDGLPEVWPDRQVHDGEGVRRMRAACELAARVLQFAGTLVEPAVTTDEIDRAVHRMIVGAGAYPSPLGYGGFPKSVCTSVNECTCHGIPDSRALQDGDIVNIDVTVYLNGYHGDTSRTYLVGDVDECAKQLVDVTEECMMRGISACKHGASFKEIGLRISEVAEKYGYSVDPFVGHGVGRIFHSEPIIWHTYDYEPGFMVVGQTFTIEPTLSMGSTRCVVWDDGWTAVAADGSVSAQFEHTVLVTADGAEVLTKCR